MTWNTHHSRKTSKKRSRATEQFTAPPINWRWVQKHSQTVHGTSIYQKDFSLPPIDYKSTDLESKSQQKGLKKAVKGHRTVHSTTNELEVASKALTDCAWDLHLPKRLQPDTHRLQIQ